ncbi:MAG: group 1 truncated hemoglobin [Rhodospirillales bacterium]
MASTVFERCGGFATVRRVVSAFYDRVLDSPTLSPHFEAIEMKTLIDHQTKFIASVMGGPASFSDEALKRAHARLGISRAEFEEIVGLLRETLEDFDVSAGDVAQVIGEVRRREPVIVSRYD